MRIRVTGAGPAGSSAAITAALAGADVHLHDQSRFPRHKVCGEFLSPEILPLLEQLGVSGAFQQAQPAAIRRLTLRFGEREKNAKLPEIAYGLSRFVFDQLLFDRAMQASRPVPHSYRDSEVMAQGRHKVAPVVSLGRRLFGFKAHYRGPATDAIELHFFDSGYVGINAIENGLTNVCGLAAEGALRAIDFRYDELLARVPSLAQRLGPLSRAMEWMTTGPLIFTNRFDQPAVPRIYYAGDALSFVDPFTGSGLYCAVLSGAIAGRSAAKGLDAAEHLRLCRAALGRPSAFSSLFRNAIASGWAGRVAPFVPAQLLFRLTRPRLQI